VTHSYVEPFIKGGDMAITRQPIDFLGVNYYSPAYIKLDRSNPSYIGPGDPPGGVPLDAFGREIDPSGLGEILTRLRHHYANPKVLITENGASDPLSATAPAILDDKFRIDYLRRHLEAVKIAMEQGSRIGGYFVWSLVDNWEWEYGFTSKFGLCAMDRKTGTRMPKASYEWLKTLAKTNVLPAV
jgi:beta-glucosidase